MCVNEVSLLFNQDKAEVRTISKDKTDEKNVTRFRVVCVCVWCGVVRVRECGCVYMRAGYVRGECAI